MNEALKEQRPWGYFEVLYADESSWLKRIVINPGQSLSYQYHQHRIEYWWPEGNGIRAIVGDFDFELAPSCTPRAVTPFTKHRLYNPCQHPVSVLEWAVGRPDENDIERLDDNYGR